MFNVGGGELLVILLIALLVLGPDRLPDFARKAGKLMGDVRRVSQGFQTEIRQAMDFDGDKSESAPSPPRLVSPPAPGPDAAAPSTTPDEPATPPASGTDSPGDESASGTSAA